MRRMPSRFNSFETFSQSSTFRHTEGSGVTTVTSQPSLARYFAMFPVRTEELARTGGKRQAKNKSFGRLRSWSICPFELVLSGSTLIVRRDRDGKLSCPQNKVHPAPHPRIECQRSLKDFLPFSTNHGDIQCLDLGGSFTRQDLL